MKILQAINSLTTAGAEKLIVDCVPLYQNKGLEVDVLLLDDAPSDFRNLLKQNSNGEIFGLSKGSVYNPLLIFKIIPYLKKYDVVHAHLFPTLYWVVLAKWFSFSSTKIVYTEHNTHNRRRDNFLLKWIDRIIYRGLSKIITIADEVDFNLKNHLKYKSTDKLQIINNGVSISTFIHAKPLPKETFFTKDDFILIQVSSFREQKDQPTLVRALTFLPERIKLLLVGDGPLKILNEELTEELQLTDRVKFLGIRNDIPQLLNTSDIVILSSKHEGLSLSSIEGMSVKAFIASDVPGLREIVKGYGLFFKQGDSKELAEKILSLVNDPEYYKEVASRCAERAKDFDIHTMVEKYIKVYKSVVKHI